MPYGEIGGGFFGLFLGGFWILLLVLGVVTGGAFTVKKLFRKNKTPNQK